MSIKVIRSPLPGTFYRKPSPEEAEFVKQGDTIKKEDVICLIEVMKMFNQVSSEYDGKVIKFLVNDGDAVTAGQDILEIEINN